MTQRKPGIPLNVPENLTAQAPPVPDDAKVDDTVYGGAVDIRSLPETAEVHEANPAEIPPSKQTNLFDWITTREAAEYSGYDIEHIRRLIRRGRITAVKKGRDWWINFDSFSTYLTAMQSSEDGRAGPKPARRGTS